MPVLMPVDGPAAAPSVEQLGSQIVALAGRLAAATCRWLLLVAQFDARDGHVKMGLASTARWLSFSCGLAQRTAVGHVRFARAPASYPALPEQRASGRFSYSHARAISRLATAADACDLLTHVAPRPRSPPAGRSRPSTPRSPPTRPHPDGTAPGSIPLTQSLDSFSSPPAGQSSAASATRQRAHVTRRSRPVAHPARIRLLERTGRTSETTG